MTTLERVVECLRAAELPALTEDNTVYTSKGKVRSGVAWAIEFDERGRFIRAYRTDLANGVEGIYVRSLTEVLKSMGLSLKPG